MWADAQMSSLQIMVPSGHKEGINGYSLSPDNKRFVTTSSDKICIWNANTGKLIRTLEHRSDRTYNSVHSIFISNDLLVTANHEGGVYLWNVNTGVIKDTTHVELED